MGLKVPAKVSKLLTHLSKTQAVASGIGKDRRTGNEIVDTLAMNFVERAFEVKELRKFKVVFNKDVNIGKKSWLCLNQTRLTRRPSTSARCSYEGWRGWPAAWPESVA